MRTVGYACTALFAKLDRKPATQRTASGQIPGSTEEELINKVVT